MQDYDDETDNEELEDEEAFLQNMYMILVLDEKKFALPIGYIREIQQLPPITPLPDYPPYIKGVIKLRERVMTVVDTRNYFGMKGFHDIDKEFLKMLADRKQDHINWLNALENAIENNTEFKLSRDPHGCAFGKWYDNYKTNDIGMSVYLNQFDSPHKSIHALADKAFHTLENSGVDAAKRIIENAKNNELTLMIKLFDSAEQVLIESRKELMVVVEYKEEFWAFSFDNIDRILSIENERVEKSDVANNKFIEGIYTIADDVIILLNMDKLMQFR